MPRDLSSETSLHWHRGPVCLWVAVAALVTSTIWLWSSSLVLLSAHRVQHSNGWRASSAPRIYWPPPPIESESNGYLRVRCTGGLTEQRSAICNAVVVARIMNATLVLPELDTNSFWDYESGFVDIYDTAHFIKTLKDDVRIVMSVPKITAQGKTKKLRAYKILPPRDAQVTWYRTTALEAIRKYGAIYLTPFSHHRLAEEIDDPELQRLRCRCIDIFTPKDRGILLKYQKEHFPGKIITYRERKLIGKCPLTPEEAGLIIHAMGFDNTTRIYLASGKLIGGKHFMKPLKAMYPHLENHSMVGSGKMEENTRGLAGSAVDYMVCLLSDIFIPTYDGPSNFANNLMGHRLYYGFRTTITPNRKALAPIFIDMEEGHASGYERIRQVIFNTHFGAPHKRIHPESFYTNSWPECFCQMKAKNHADRCPPNTVNDVLESQFQNKEDIEADAINQKTNSSSQIEELGGGTELAKVY
ncbi:hypothetical protein ACP4OV_017235 [Aristida adscensionis]